MSSFVVMGGKPLSGCVTVSGAKNSALPILFSSIAAKGISKIHNIPNIGDVKVAIQLLEGFGADVKLDGTTLIVDTSNLNYREPTEKLTCSLRASTYLIGATLARFGRANIGLYGGCNFAPRPIDLHIYAMEEMGAERVGNSLFLKNTKDSHIVFPKTSVGATVNALILASSIEKKTIIDGCAIEPHILTLVDYLRKTGAKIEIENRRIVVYGRELEGREVVLNGDMIEAATYHVISLMTGGNIVVCGYDIEELSAFCDMAISSGASCENLDTGTRFYGEMTTTVDITASPYPGFATDLCPICAPLLAAFKGGFVRDLVFPARFGYLSELALFGLSYSRLDGGAHIHPSHIHSACATAPDLRGGMAALILALNAKGRSVIHSAEILMRGYANLCDKLSSLGAEIDFFN